MLIILTLPDLKINLGAIQRRNRRLRQRASNGARTQTRQNHLIVGRLPQGSSVLSAHYHTAPPPVSPHYCRLNTASNTKQSTNQQLNYQILNSYTITD